jgi:hypothetical protein
MRMDQRFSGSLCASMTFPDLGRLRERSERQGCGASVLTLHSAPLCYNSVFFYHVASATRASVLVVIVVVISNQSTSKIVRCLSPRLNKQGEFDGLSLQTG